MMTRHTLHVTGRAVLILSLVTCHVSLRIPAAHASAADATELNNQGIEAAKAGRLEDGIALVRQALQHNPADPLFRTNLSGMLTDWAGVLEQQGRSSQAMTALQEALQLSPENGPALGRLGDLTLTVRGDLEHAIALWRRAAAALSGASRQAILERLAQAERDAAIERDFPALSTSHFLIRFEGAEHEAQAAALGVTLEQVYAQLSQAMGVVVERVPVIVYTSGNFQRVAGRRDWALGLYDGRIRVRLDDIGADWGEAILRHELAHAFLARGFGANLPTWIHEGFAQSQEPPLPMTEHQQALRQAILSRNAWIPLKWLDRRFLQPSNLEDVERAYMESRVVIERLVERHGSARLAEFLRRLSQSEPIESAFDAAFAPQRWIRADQGNFD